VSGTVGIPPPPPPGMMTCPNCHAPVDPTKNRFCGACGAPLPTAGAPPSPGAAPVDIRKAVDDDRGILKRLQLLVPGFHGYRVGEDIRAADSLLRQQVADKIHLSVQTMTDCRAQLTQSGQFQVLTDLAPLITELKDLEGTVRNAEQGYSGISPAVRVKPEELDSLYQYDYGFAQAADQLGASVSAFKIATLASGGTGVASTLQTIRSQVGQLQTAWQARLRAVEGIQV
jgi:hypothetical protein